KARISSGPEETRSLHYEVGYMTASVPTRVFPLESPLTSRGGSIYVANFRPCTSRVRVMRRDLSSTVHAPSTRRSSLLLSGSQGLGQAIALPVDMPGLLPP